MKVLVSGASGKLGRLVVPRLVAAGHDVIGVVRRDEAAEEVNAAGGTGTVVDLEGSADAIRQMFDGVDAVVWTAGADIMTGTEHSNRLDRDATLLAIASAADTGVTRWIQISSLFADRIEQAPPPLVPFLTNKVAADDAVRATGMQWTVIRPSHLTLDESKGVFAVQEAGLTSGALPRADLADLVTALITDGLAVGKSFDVTTGDDSIADALSAL